MADALELSLAVCDYDRCRAVLDGRARVDGCRILPTALEPEEAFHRAFKFQEFDVTELSMSSFTMLTARGDCPYVGIPAFVSRLFRHSGIYIRTDRGIETAADLKGKVIGLPEYQITATVWIRGILEDEYGVDTRSVAWRQGGLEDPGRTERSTIALPGDIDLKPIPAERTLSDMLATGEIDALITARAPSCFLKGTPGVARMFPDYRAAEQDYYRRTGIFPIMHLIGIRRSIYEHHPWVAVNLYKAFLEAKRHAMYELSQIGHLFVSLPWSVMERDQTVELMGEDFWSYGAEENRKVLETFLGYHHRQGLSERRVTVEEMFAPSTLELTKI
ncbi:ABC transporter substrate-binding protein [Marivibrio halodurans]|uniref:ABC transporter substrate-binding protein n=1 Tax=Marivibrio halodurans TaxID=2039722 RepID=A0A8J7V584_9PROT|nr:ABC transporter substrate-binding protein [Marivibrio halodurans]MBP5858589.1 ABC transporter substrate-binding protein [Marivibrio halodurans]